MITLGSKNNGLRTFYLEDKEIRSIFFYEHGRVIYNTRAGWIEADGNSSSTYDLPGLTLENPIHRRNKLNLEKGGNFYIVSEKRALRGGKLIDVYVDISQEDISIGEEEIVECYSTSSGVTKQKIRKLTATFGLIDASGKAMPFGWRSGGRQCISVYVQNSIFTEVNEYGMQLAVIEQYLAKSGITILGLETLIKDKVLLDMLLKAHNSKM